MCQFDLHHSFVRSGLLIRGGRSLERSTRGLNPTECPISPFISAVSRILWLRGDGAEILLRFGIDRTQDREVVSEAQIGSKQYI